MSNLSQLVSINDDFVDSIIIDFLSLNNFEQAFEKVAQNHGSAGIDEETISLFTKQKKTKLLQLRDEVSTGNYQPFPLKQVIIPKSENKQRELKIPTVRDRIVQQALLNVLTPIFEPSFSDSSFAYRPNLSYLNAVETVAQWRDNGYHYVLDGDIVQFFDNINHQRLLQKLRSGINHTGILCLIKAWITSPVITTEKQQIFTEKGVPQGAVISPLLANIYLDEFDHLLNQTDLKLVRYADDFLILATTQERIIQAYLEVYHLLNSLGLELHSEKSEITNFQRGFRFLGHGFLDRAIFPLESKSETAKKKEQIPEIITFQTAEESPFKSSFISVEKFFKKAMGTIYLMEQGITLGKIHQRFVIYLKENQQIEIPIREVERILVFGNIQLSTQVINACLDAEILVLYLSPLGQYRGHLWNLENTNFSTQLLQVKQQDNQLFQFNTCLAIVKGKLLNSKQLLLRVNRQRKSAEIYQAILGITNDLSSLDNVDNIDSLRGYEGITAARYFPAFGLAITNNNFSFRLRNRQPPTDPVNALLSFGYTLLFNNVLSLIIAEGLSPYLGNFHYGEEQKPYLAFDLMEEFRSPIVDSLVLNTVNHAWVKPTDFQSIQGGGIYLTNEGKKFFLKQFEKRMNEETSYPDLLKDVSYRQAIQLQIRQYKCCLNESLIYQPFLRTI